MAPAAAPMRKKTKAGASGKAQFARQGEQVAKPEQKTNHLAGGKAKIKSTLRPIFKPLGRAKNFFTPGKPKKFQRSPEPS